MQVVKNIISLMFACSLFCTVVQGPVSREYQLKAAFLYNFCQFVNWPSTAFANEEEPLVIGVLGNNPFGAYLEETVSGEKVGRHPVHIKYYTQAEDATDCHVIFIAGAGGGFSDSVIAQIKGQPILTISDQKDFLARHGMIRFYNGNNKVRFEINVEEAKAAGLEVSSKLLRLADIYEK